MVGSLPLMCLAIGSMVSSSALWKRTSSSSKGVSSGSQSLLGHRWMRRVSAPAAISRGTLTVASGSSGFAMITAPPIDVTTAAR